MIVNERIQHILDLLPAADQAQFILELQGCAQEAREQLLAQWENTASIYDALEWVEHLSAPIELNVDAQRIQHILDNLPTLEQVRFLRELQRAADEREQLLVKWEGTAISYAAGTYPDTTDRHAIGAYIRAGIMKRFPERAAREAEEALAELTRLSQEMGLYELDHDFEAGERAVKEARANKRKLDAAMRAGFASPQNQRALRELAKRNARAAALQQLIHDMGGENITEEEWKREP